MSRLDGKSHKNNVEVSEGHLMFTLHLKRRKKKEEGVELYDSQLSDQARSMLSELDRCTNKDPLMPRIKRYAIISKIISVREKDREISVHVDFYTQRVTVHGSTHRSPRPQNTLKEKVRVLLVGLIEEVLESYLNSDEWQRQSSGEIYLNFDQSGENPMPTEGYSFSHTVA